MLMIDKIWNLIFTYLHALMRGIVGVCQAAILFSAIALCCLIPLIVGELILHGPNHMLLLIETLRR